MLDLTLIKAITLDLDDTLWPIWPTIEKAEKVLAHWLSQHAPLTAELFADPAARHEIREQVTQSNPGFTHDLSAQRRETIRQALLRCGDDPLLADLAFEVFFAERNRVTLFDDALPALEFLARRFPLVALSNGNADIHRVGIGAYFKAGISAREFGVGKPDPRIFHAAAGAAGVRPEQVLHVGDDAALDVLAALGCGMQAVWVNRADHLWTHAQAPHETVTTLTELCELLQPEGG
ncbi:MAG: HAD-superfamily hydrolase subfamily variant 3 [Polaromonas sp.]|nr:HAD-superfamily hydrolase subfamily variant 3 [Polaromonas sp.]